MFDWLRWLQSKWARFQGVGYGTLLGLLTVGFYGVYLAPRCWKYTYVTWDAIRDIITTQHLLAGGAIWADPVVTGYYPWYPPLHALGCAGLIALWDLDVFSFYALTPALLNLWLVPAWILILRRLTQVSHPAAFWGTLSLTAMPWIVTHVIAYPTVMAHAVPFAAWLFWGYLWLQNHAPAGLGWKWAAFAAILGLLGLYHPPTFLIVLGTLSLHLLLGGTETGWRRWRMWATLAGISLAVCAPYWLPNLLQPIRNPAPLAYLAPGLTRWEMILPGTTLGRSLPFIFFIGLGLAVCWQNRRESSCRWVWALLLITILGQIPAYTKLALEAYAPSWHAAMGNQIPIVLPHEFQLYFQLTLTLFLGMGLLLFIRWKTWLYPTVYYTLWTWFLFSLLLSLKELPTHSQVFVWPYRLEGTYTALVEAIQTQTTVTDGICAPN
ncbi:MAG: hypothetical protein RBU29_13130, partial [bacterium]|nr:hypothetical protein [bacterium]